MCHYWQLLGAEFLYAMIAEYKLKLTIKYKYHIDFKKSKVEFMLIMIFFQ